MFLFCVLVHSQSHCVVPKKKRPSRYLSASLGLHSPTIRPTSKRARSAIRYRIPALHSAQAPKASGDHRRVHDATTTFSPKNHPPHHLPRHLPSKVRVGAMNWLTTLGLAAVVIPSLYIYTVSIVAMRFPVLRNKRICLLIAHPDDEAMFFAPSVLALTKPETGNHVKILCLSSGQLYPSVVTDSPHFVPAQSHPTSSPTPRLSNRLPLSRPLLLQKY